MQIFGRHITLPFTVILPIAFLGLAVLGFLLLLALGQRSSPQRLPQEKSWRVLVVPAHRGRYSPTLILNGVTESPYQVTLEAAIEANVVKIAAREGDVVNAGQVLILLDTEEVALTLSHREADKKNLEAQINAEIIRAKADKAALLNEKSLLTLSLSDLERQQILMKRKLGAQALVDEKSRQVQQQQLIVTQRQLAIDDHDNRLMQLQARFQGANALVEKAKLDLRRTEIKAPFAGRITKVFVAPGSRVQNSESMIELYDISNTEVRAQIPSRYVNTLEEALQKESPVTAIANIEGKAYTLQLNRFAGKVGVGSGGVDALFSVTDPRKPSALGRPHELVLTLPPVDNAYQFPAIALYGDSRLYKVVAERLVSINVTRLGNRVDANGKDFVLVRSPALQEDDRILATPLANARDGLLVSASEQP